MMREIGFRSAALRAIIERVKTMNSSYLKCYVMVVAVIRSHSHDQVHDSYSVSVVTYAVNNNLVCIKLPLGDL